MSISIEDTVDTPDRPTQGNLARRQTCRRESARPTRSSARPIAAAGESRSKLLAFVVGAAAACLFDATAHAGPKDPPKGPPVAHQHAIIDGHSIQPRRGTPDGDHLDRDDTRAVEDLYRELMMKGANEGASNGR